MKVTSRRYFVCAGAPPNKPLKLPAAGFRLAGSLLVSRRGRITRGRK
jgi:hypothetical protein